jgi:hypothetical protein
MAIWHHNYWSSAAGPVISSRAPGLIEVVPAGGATLRVDTEVDEGAAPR